MWGKHVPKEVSLFDTATTTLMQEAGGVTIICRHFEKVAKKLDLKLDFAISEGLREQALEKEVAKFSLIAEIRYDACHH